MFLLVFDLQYSQGLYKLLTENNDVKKISNIGHLAMESLRVQSIVPKIPNEIDLKSTRCWSEKLFFNKVR